MFLVLLKSSCQRVLLPNRGEKLWETGVLRGIGARSCERNVMEAVSLSLSLSFFFFHMWTRTFPGLRTSHLVDIWTSKRDTNKNIANLGRHVEVLGLMDFSLHEFVTNLFRCAEVLGLLFFLFFLLRYEHVKKSEPKRSSSKWLLSLFCHEKCKWAQKLVTRPQKLVTWAQKLVTRGP